MYLSAIGLLIILGLKGCNTQPNDRLGKFRVKPMTFVDDTCSNANECDEPSPQLMKQMREQMDDEASRFQEFIKVQLATIRKQTEKVAPTAQPSTKRTTINNGVDATSLNEVQGTETDHVTTVSHIGTTPSMPQNTALAEEALSYGSTNSKNTIESFTVRGTETQYLTTVSHIGTTPSLPPKTALPGEGSSHGSTIGQNTIESFTKKDINMTTMAQQIVSSPTAKTTISFQNTTQSSTAGEVSTVSSEHAPSTTANPPFERGSTRETTSAATDANPGGVSHEVRSSPTANSKTTDKMAQPLTGKRDLHQTTTETSSSLPLSRTTSAITDGTSAHFDAFTSAHTTPNARPITDGDFTSGTTSHNGQTVTNTGEGTLSPTEQTSLYSTADKYYTTIIPMTSAGVVTPQTELPTNHAEPQIDTSTLSLQPDTEGVITSKKLDDILNSTGRLAWYGYGSNATSASSQTAAARHESEFCDVSHNGKCFHVILHDAQDVNFSEARDMCQSIQWNLANIYDASHYAKIADYLRGRMSSGRRVWLGMTIDPQTMVVSLTSGTNARLSEVKWLPEFPKSEQTRTRVSIHVKRDSNHTYQGLFNLPLAANLRGALCEE